MGTAIVSCASVFALCVTVWSGLLDGLPARHASGHLKARLSTLYADRAGRGDLISLFLRNATCAHDGHALDRRKSLAGWCTGCGTDGDFICMPATAPCDESAPSRCET